MALSEGTRRSTRVRKEKRPLSPEIEEPRKRERRRNTQPTENSPRKKISPEENSENDEEKPVVKEEAEQQPSKNKVVREDTDDENIEDNDEPEEEKDEFDLKMFNLRRVGEKAAATSSIPLNRRGMPQRIRKKNKLFYDDNVLTPPIQKRKPQQNKRNPENRISAALANKASTSKPQDGLVAAAVDDSNRQSATSAQNKIAKTLRNLLRLQKAQKWVYYEWFYSNIDRVLFYGTNDFLMCLRENFAPLRTTNLTRMEWSVIRRLMGKPRRCSEKFFREERATLQKRRSVIREIQQRKLRDLALVRDMPDRIPLLLSVGTRVTARLRSPQAGLFTGRVDGCDPRDNSYRITFDRNGLGTHSIPDYEVLADGDVDMVSLSTLQRRYLVQRMQVISQPQTASDRQRQLIRISGNWDGPVGQRWSHHFRQPNDSDRIHRGVTIKSSFPRHFFEMVVHVCRLLREKRDVVGRLRVMNDDAERMLAEGSDISLSLDWQKKYAELVIQLESLNLSLARYLVSVQRLCVRVAPDESRAAVIQPSVVRDASLKEASRLLDECKAKTGSKTTNSNVAELVTELVALIVQIQSLSEARSHPHELSVLHQSMARIRSIISPTNIAAFQQHVEVHVHYIIENTLMNRQKVSGAASGPLSSLITTTTSASAMITTTSTSTSTLVK